MQRLHSAHDLFYNFSLLFYVKMRPHKGLANGGVGQVCRGSILDAEALFSDPKPYVIRREGEKRAKKKHINSKSAGFAPLKKIPCNLLQSQGI